MTDTIKCAVLGLGRLGLHHAKSLKQRAKHAELVKIVDPIESHVHQVAEELEVPEWTTEPDEAIEDPSIDALVIVTPTSTHGDLIKKAAKQGKHVFVEKPLTQTLAEADEVIQAIEDSGIVCQVGFMRRFDPAYVDAKERIDAGEIGEPLYFKSITRDSGSPPAEFIKHSGGIFLDCSIHDYDIARYLMNSEITTVAAQGRILINDFMKEFNDVDQSITYVEFASGAAGDIEASRTSPYGHDIRTEVIGSEGTVLIGSLRQQNVTVLNNKGSNYEIVPDFQTRFNDAYFIEIQKFVDCVREQSAPRVTAWDSKINMEIALEATQSFLAEGRRRTVHIHTESSL
ncbi:Gfo/Idh/MocA family oxidoreductase [Salsuginibacillus kocurii]|uniref:Gfo/Idh/MocA family oxidoreductase n=1 Tax=Salsuginibacillus kocurii TaxID=427078 RepID=UPI0003683058|nr:Gfo/Idh/MocA family oxidoreductase [Salsuginibacillus kocurii]